jgi:hypothetical protein
MYVTDGANFLQYDVPYKNTDATMYILSSHRHTHNQLCPEQPEMTQSHRMLALCWLAPLELLGM